MKKREAGQTGTFNRPSCVDGVIPVVEEAEEEEVQSQGIQTVQLLSMLLSDRQKRIAGLVLGPIAGLKPRAGWRLYSRDVHMATMAWRLLFIL